MIEVKRPGDDLLDGLVGQHLAKEHIANASAWRLACIVTTKSPDRLQSDVEITGRQRDALGHRVHDARLVQDGGERLQPTMAIGIIAKGIERTDAPLLYQRIQQQLLEQTLGRRLIELSLDEIAA